MTKYFFSYNLYYWCTFSELYTEWNWEHIKLFVWEADRYMDR